MLLEISHAHFWTNLVTDHQYCRESKLTYAHYFRGYSHVGSTRPTTLILLEIVRLSNNGSRWALNPQEGRQLTGSFGVHAISQEY